MTADARASGLVRRVADCAITAAPAGSRDRAGLAGSSPAAAAVANGMVRVAACSLTLARRGVARRADRAVDRAAAERCRRRAQQSRRGRCDRAASELIVQSERRQARRWALDLVAAERIRCSGSPAPGRGRLHVRLARRHADHRRWHLDGAAGLGRQPRDVRGVPRLRLRVLHLVALEVVRNGLGACREGPSHPEDHQCSEPDWAEGRLHGTSR
jgi:hypothetical protein